MLIRKQPKTDPLVGCPLDGQPASAFLTLASNLLASGMVIAQAALTATIIADVYLNGGDFAR